VHNNAALDVAETVTMSAAGVAEGAVATVMRAGERGVGVGLGRIVALHYRSFPS
jgi:hypothetical protein